MVFLLLCKLTRLAIHGSQKFDSHKWPTVFVDEVTGKPHNFEWYFVWIIIFYFKKKKFLSYAFYNKRLQTLFKNQLDRSEARYSFNFKILFSIKVHLEQILTFDFTKENFCASSIFLSQKCSLPFLKVGILCLPEEETFQFPEVTLPVPVQGMSLS